MLLQTTPAPVPAATPGIEPEILELGRRLGERHRSLQALRRGAYDRGMNLVSADPQLRAALFRLVDVAPACAGTPELADHLAAYLDDVESEALPVALGGRAADSPVLNRATGRVASSLVRQMAGRFIVGESIADAAPTLRRLWGGGVAATVDLLGEATVTHAEGKAYADRCEEALRRARLCKRRLACEAAARADSIGRATARQPLGEGDGADASDPCRGAGAGARRRRRPPAPAAAAGAGGGRPPARRHGVDGLARTDRSTLVLDLLGEPEFADGPSAGPRAPGLSTRLRATSSTGSSSGPRAADRAVPLTVRIVKGAYWDHETIEAAQHGWVPPVSTEKAESDRCFERLSRRLIDAHPLVRTAIASHNLRSVAHAIAYAQAPGSPPATSSSRSCAGSATSCRTRSPPPACAAAPTARSATWWPAWPTWCVACWRTPPTTHSSPAARASADAEELLRAP